MKGFIVIVFGNNLVVWKKVFFVDLDYIGDSNDGGVNDLIVCYIGMGVNIKF